jgi:TonB family protein
MRDNRLYSSFYISIGLHSLFVVAIVAYILISGPSHKMSSITVSLVESPVRGSGNQAAAAAKPEIQPKEKEPEPAEEEPSATITHKIAEPHKSSAADRIAALQARKNVERKRLLTVSKNGSRAAGGGTPGGGTYDSVIGGIIQRNWANSDFLNRYRSLSAIITIRIERNGNITILGWEKKSNNQLFDREALRAITNSSPLPPPPAEMERSINFDPKKGR